MGKIETVSVPDLYTGERPEAARKWYDENKQAVDAYNRFVDEYGLFSDGMRAF